VGLGCEYTQPEKIRKVAEASGRLSDWFYIQDSGGTLSSIAKGKRIVTEMARSLAQNTRRVSMGLADLVIGSECGGSDATSGLAANPVVGAVSDLLVDAGGTAIWEEIVEMIGLRTPLVARAARPSVAAAIACAYYKAEEYCRAVRQYSVSPGNFAGGLTTIEEKSLGSYAKSGSRPIQGVIKVAERPSSHGLWLMDTVPDPHFMQFGYNNPNDTEGLMDLMSGGAQILFYTTGRGSCTGSPIAPTIKVTGNPHTYARLEGDMDFNAGRVLTGETTVSRAAEELLALVVRVAGGEPTKPERLGHREYFVMYKHQNTPSLEEGCRA
jgi:altronate hydrolase